ncbi:MAG: tRNA (adenosine(37)-N6)-dimethylallyltransferase MiaA [Christensenellales bacterium]
MNKVIIVGGATASGKSDFGVELAKILDTEIISCDSMQIYRGLDVGTAKITTEQMQGIKHHLIDIVEPNQPFSVSEWREHALRIIDELHEKGKIPIVVGGTGLYIDSLVYQLSFFCNGDENLRQRLKNELENQGAQKMHDLLKSIDPKDAEKIHPNNTKRLLRALEIYYSTGGVKSEKQERKINDAYDICLVVIGRDRQESYKRIDIRVDEMWRQGLVDEVKSIIDGGLADWNCQSMQAIGYKEFKDYFDGKCDLEQVKNQIKINSRHYAKRQISWLKRYDFGRWFDIDSERDEAIKYAVERANGKV